MNKTEINIDDVITKLQQIIGQQVWQIAVLQAQIDQLQKTGDNNAEKDS